MGVVISLVIVGLVAGALARLVVPGRDPMGIIGTLVLGIVGSFVGGFLGALVFQSGDVLDRGLRPAGFLGSLLGAVLVLLIYRWVLRHPGVHT